MVASQPSRTWKPQDFAQQLYITEAAAQQQYQKLIDQGLMRTLEGGDGAEYAPLEDTAAAVQELSSDYQQWRVRIIEYIYSKPSESVYGFARAFKIKGDREE
ncbi:MAG TPA: hypothetical protein VJM53_01400 [Burkholderiales bacterium]|nr:hypothetical protein [Burkholderiales bacterium]